MITLSSLSQATAQEVFDQVATHLLTQKEKSQEASGVCLYRSEKGLACAAGCLISDEEYEELKGTIEPLSWLDLCEEELVPGDHQTLIFDLQSLHDDIDVARWADSLKALALEHNLNADVVITFKETNNVQ